MADRKFVNLTPNEVVIVREEDGKQFIIPPSGKIAFARMIEERRSSVNGIPTVQRRYSEHVYNLPPYDKKSIFLVSPTVIEALTGTHRDDVVTPDTGVTAIEDSEGNIIAVTRLIRPWW